MDGAMLLMVEDVVIQKRLRIQNGSHRDKVARHDIVERLYWLTLRLHRLLQSLKESNQLGATPPNIPATLKNSMSNFWKPELFIFYSCQFKPHCEKERNS